MGDVAFHITWGLGGLLMCSNVRYTEGRHKGGMRLGLLTKFKYHRVFNIATSGIVCVACEL